MTMGQYDPKLIIEQDKVKFLAKKAHLRSKLINVSLRSFMLAKGYLWCEFGEDSLKSKLWPNIAPNLAQYVAKKAH